MVVVDCNILVHLLLSGEHTENARELLQKDADWHSDVFVLVELTNALATAMRVRGLSLQQAASILSKAEQVVAFGLHVPTHSDVLALAADLKISAYDARYLVVARDLDFRLVTEDSKLRKSAPKLTQSLSDALAPE